MKTKYHSRLATNATYMRVFEGERILQGQEVIDVINEYEKKIAKLENAVAAFTRNNFVKQLMYDRKIII
jgi:hypothetical protein